MVDFAAACEEWLAHLDEIANEHKSQLGLSDEEIKTFLTENIAFRMDEMKKGLEIYFQFAVKHELNDAARPLEFIGP